MLPAKRNQFWGGLGNSFSLVQKIAYPFAF
jgi:hypothetical protein